MRGGPGIRGKPGSVLFELPSRKSLSILGRRRFAYLVAVSLDAGMTTDSGSDAGFPLLSAALEAPRIYVTDYPEAERDAVSRVRSNLRKLIQIVEGFQDSLDLFIQSKAWVGQVNTARRTAMDAGDDQQTKTLLNSSRRLQGWIEIAARNGAMLTYTAAMLRESNGQELTLCPTLSAKVDRKLTKESWRIMQAAFPDVYNIRTSAAHPYELGSTTADHAAHAIQTEIETPGMSIAGGGEVFMDGNMEVIGDELTYASSIKGKHVAYTLSPRTLAELVKAVEVYLSAFAQVE